MKASVHVEYRDAAAHHWWFRARRRIFARLLDPIAAPGGDARILEVGPGSGVNVPILASRGELVVVDRDAGSLAACRAVGIAGVFADATHLPFADASFDLACALDVIEHVDDDRAALGELHRVLRPGGHLLATVPALRLLWGRQDVLAEHRRRYARREFAAAVQDNGFEITRLSYFNTLLFPPILLARLLMRPFLSRSVSTGRSDLAVRAPFGLDRVLEALFAAEGAWLVRRDLPIGVSLLAIARRKVATT
jgi:SAM-dependent methyltransferase